MIRIKNLIFISILGVLLFGCVSIPRNTANVCSIFSDKYFWFKNAEATEKKWGAPIELQKIAYDREDWKNDSLYPSDDECDETPKSE